jgi:phosphoenolpyruvate carboxylase
MQLAAITLRKAPLEALHRQQIHLLREWRNTRDADSVCPRTDALLGKLFLSVNAIAGGVRNTG